MSNLYRIEYNIIFNNKKLPKKVICSKIIINNNKIIIKIIQFTRNYNYNKIYSNSIRNKK